MKLDHRWGPPRVDERRAIRSPLTEDSERKPDDRGGGARDPTGARPRGDGTRAAADSAPAPRRGGGTDDDAAAAAAIAAASSASSSPVEGVDYVMHAVLPTDTLSGICLRYSVEPIRLRRLNVFSGSNLLLAPSRLIVPLGGREPDGTLIRSRDRTSIERKMSTLLSDFPALGVSEARAYLLMSGWDLRAAATIAKEDAEWEANYLSKVNELSRGRAWARSSAGANSVADPSRIERKSGWGRGGYVARRRDSSVKVHVAVEIELPRIGPYMESASVPPIGAAKTLGDDCAGSGGPLAPLARAAAPLMDGLVSVGDELARQRGIELPIIAR